MTRGSCDYGRAGLVGIAPPQANPTVEAEVRLLLPPSVGMVVARLTSSSSDSVTRLREYLERLPQTLTQFDTLPLSAFGFACTASSYLMGSERQKRTIGDLEARCGYPIVLATDAIAWRLQRAGARRIGLVSPYPPDLTQAATRHWQEAGYDVVGVRRIETDSADTRSIYSLGSSDAEAAVDELSSLAVDAVLISGTGLPSLALLAGAKQQPLVISSNYCLAQRLLSLLGLPEDKTDGWRARLIEVSTGST